MPEIAELITGDRGNAIYFDIALINIFFTNWSDLPYTLFRLDHRPVTFSVFTIGRVLVQVPVTVALVVWADIGPMGVLIGQRRRRLPAQHAGPADLLEAARLASGVAVTCGR